MKSWKPMVFYAGIYAGMDVIYRCPNVNWDNAYFIWVLPLAALAGFEPTLFFVLVPTVYHHGYSSLPRNVVILKEYKLPGGSTVSDCGYPPCAQCIRFGFFDAAITKILSLKPMRILTF